MKLLEIKNLSTVYKTDESTVCAVGGLSLSINRGETVGLVGETGAGKTTAALSIMGLLPDKVGFVTEGEIIFNGKNILKYSDADMKLLRGSEISMIFQDPMTSLNPVLTVGDQIYEVLELHNDKNLSKDEMARRVDEILELVGLPCDRKSEYPHQFSGGMKQRIVIAIALACEPLLLLADEPTTALDVTIQAQVLQMMNELKSRLNTSMLLITHDLGVVAQMCDKVAVMYAGEIIETGTDADIFEGKNHHPYTVGLFSSIPDMTESKKRLSPIDGMMPDPANLPSGCRFHPRCKHCLDICKTVPPDYRDIDGHLIKCHLLARNEV